MGGGTLALVGSEPAHPDEVLHEVRLQGLPVAVHAAATEHLEELRREFLLILDTSPQEDSVPRRVADLAMRLAELFDGLGSSENAELAAAVARGDESIDLTYFVPSLWAVACGAILDAIAEVDAYCRRGDLLTLAISDEHHRYLRWVFGEFIRQVDGAAPTSWEEWVLSEPLPAVSASGGPVRAV